MDGSAPSTASQVTDTSAAALTPHVVSAVIVSGGSGQRLGNVDKAQLVVGGRTLLDRAVSAVCVAREIVIVGPPAQIDPTPIDPTPIDPRPIDPRPIDPRPIDPVPIDRDTAPPVSFAQEDPPAGGPAAGILAGRDALQPGADALMVLAVDMPGVTAATVHRLMLALTPEVDGAFLHATDGRRQLAGVVRIARLDDVRPRQDEVSGLAVHRLLAPLRLAEVAAIGAEGEDVDTWEDLDRHNQSHGQSRGRSHSHSHGHSRGLAASDDFAAPLEP
jgi:molybdopterin-guanine dinucleotide biosynthesis protein A